VAGSSGSSTNPYMYAGDWGYRNDGDAGLMHVGARYYDAQVGRFITRDTVLSEHPYLYCEHEPVGFVDPSGHEGVWDWIKRKGRDVRSFAEDWFDWGGGDLLGSVPTIAPGVMIVSGLCAVRDIHKHGYGNRDRFNRDRRRRTSSWLAMRPDTARPNLGWSGGQNGDWNPNDPDDHRGPRDIR
jgi:RHS repeat-associated protein